MCLYENPEALDRIVHEATTAVRNAHRAKYDAFRAKLPPAQRRAFNEVDDLACAETAAIQLATIKAFCLCPQKASCPF